MPTADDRARLELIVALFVSSNIKASNAENFQVGLDQSDLNLLGAIFSVFLPVRF